MTFNEFLIKFNDYKRERLRSLIALEYDGSQVKLGKAIGLSEGKISRIVRYPDTMSREDWFKIFKEDIYNIDIISVQELKMQTLEKEKEKEC